MKRSSVCRFMLSWALSILLVSSLAPSTVFAYAETQDIPATEEAGSSAAHDRQDGTGTDEFPDSEIPFDGTMPQDPQESRAEVAPTTELLSGISPLATILIDSVVDLKAAMEAAQEGDVLTLTSAFALDMATNGPVVATIAHNNSFTILGDSGTGLTVPSGSLHFNITSTGSGRITFENIKLEGDGVSVEGGIKLNGGTYVFNTCVFESIANNATLFLEGNGANIEMASSAFNKVKLGISMTSDDLSAGKTIKLTDTSFTETASYAVRAFQASLDFESTDFLRGTGTSVFGGSSATMNNCTFAQNTSNASTPGALMPSTGSSFTLTNCSFYRNTKTSYSGGGGGAIILANGTSAAAKSSMVLDECYFGSNGLPGDLNVQGGAIYGGAAWTNADLTITNSFFENNYTTGTTTTNADGGAIGIRNSAGSNASVKIMGCNFVGNHADDDGGAMLLEGGQNTDRLNAYIANCTFTGNTCDGKPSSSFPGYNNGSGGAIQFYGMTSSEITHCTFYDNAVTDTSAFFGGGGAIALDTGNAAALAIRPVLSNNIFIANTVNDAARTRYGNVYITANSDAGNSANNGNVGYDNGATGWLNGQNVTTQTILANVFTIFNPFGNPVREYFGANVGSTTYDTQRFCYIVSPLTDEMYRDGSGPYYDPSVRTDVRGYPRDHYANAGAVEIYWTKFNPDVATGGYWVTPPPGGIQSLLSAEIYYLVTDPSPDNTLVTFLRSSFDTTAPNVGFRGWESDQPITPGGTDYPLVQPSVEVTSTKQTYTATWLSGLYRVDFDLQYDGKWGTPLLDVPDGSGITPPSPDPTREGYLLAGWYKETECINAWDFSADTVAEDIVLYAKWTPYTPLDHRVDFDLQYDGKWGTPLLDVPDGSGITPPSPDPTREGYLFAGWYKDAVCTDIWDFAHDGVFQDTILYAKWTEVKPIGPADKPDGSIANTSDGIPVTYVIFVTLLALIGLAVTGFRKILKKDCA